MGYLKITKTRVFCTAILLYMLFLPFSACKMSYSFTGAALDPSIKTFTVYYIPNRATLINPNLSQQLTDELTDKLTQQTSLEMLQSDGDLEFEGTITGYEVRPVNIQEGDLAAQNRLTVTVKMKYTNNLFHENDWEKTFSAYVDYDSNSLLTDVEDALMEEILAQLTDDIFNASIADW